MATVVNYCGFETANLIEAVSSGGTVSVSAAMSHSGNYCLRTNPGPVAGTGWARFGGLAGDGLKIGLALDTIRVGFYFRSGVAFPAIVCTLTCSALGVRATLRITSEGLLVVYNQAGALEASGTTVLNGSMWYHIEIRLTTGVAQTITVRLNETDEITDTGDYLNGVTDYVTLGPTANTTVDFRFDDLVICSDDWPPDARIGGLLAEDDGTDTDWAGDHTELDERPHDGPATVVVSTAMLEVETAAMQATATLGAVASILAVKGIAVVAWTPGD